MEENIGILIAFKLASELKEAEKAKFFREFYGYKDKSQFGKYIYHRKGILGNIPHIKLNRATILVRKEDRNKLLSFLREKGEVEVRELILTKKDKRNLFSKEGKKT